MIGGYSNNYERCWRVEDNKLRLSTIYGHTTTLFEDYSFDDQGLHTLRGPSRLDPSIMHVLERVHMPSARDFGQLTSDEPPVFISAAQTVTPRRNLVILRANGNSLHTQWPTDVNPDDRNWDLCISWYGRELPPEGLPFEYFVHQPDDRKFSAIFKLFGEDSPLNRYDNIWLPDDDLLTSWRDINKLFNIFRFQKLDLAQPSLEPTSFVTHPVTARNPDFFLRYTNFVELMCPLFTKDALKLCLPTFNASVSGFGLDHIWSLLLGRLPGRMAIIDDVAVAHTRPVGKNYNVMAAIMEENAMSALYQSSKVYEVLGGIPRMHMLG
jgi:hypothetical protein